MSKISGHIFRCNLLPTTISIHSSHNQHTDYSPFAPTTLCLHVQPWNTPFLMECSKPINPRSFLSKISAVPWPVTNKWSWYFVPHCFFQHPFCSSGNRHWRRQNDNWGGGGANIHICASCLINFFWNRLFLQSVNTNIWIFAPSIIVLPAPLEISYLIQNVCVFFLPEPQQVGSKVKYAISL